MKISRGLSVLTSRGKFDKIQHFIGCCCVDFASASARLKRGPACKRAAGEGQRSLRESSGGSARNLETNRATRERRQMFLAAFWCRAGQECGKSFCAAGL
jgi:hypothetical protein